METLQEVSVLRSICFLHPNNRVVQRTKKLNPLNFPIHTGPAASPSSHRSTTTLRVPKAKSKTATSQLRALSGTKWAQSTMPGRLCGTATKNGKERPPTRPEPFSASGSNLRCQTRRVTSTEHSGDREARNSRFPRQRTLLGSHLDKRFFNLREIK